MKFIDLFAGVGGFRIALERNGHECVFSSENNKYAREVYEYHWERPTGDIRLVDPDDIPDFDCLCAGFPCQAFSIAGARRGFEDTRGTLFFEIARILAAKRPPYILLENVKGLLNHNKGQTFRVILRTLDELGYGVEWMVLNSKFFGVPQNRERVFIIGHFRGQPRPEILPIGKGTEEVTEVRVEDDNGEWCCWDGQGSDGWTPERREVSTAIDSNYHKGVDNQRTVVIRRHRANELRNHGDTCPTLTESHEHIGGANPPMVASEDSAVCLNQHFRQPSGKAKTVGGTGPLLKKDCAHSLDIKPHQVLRGVSIRRLTPMECERLQGFPDDWTAKGVNGSISNTQRYKMMGNAVTVNVVEHIIKGYNVEIGDGPIILKRTTVDELWPDEV
jgi:DNA (cytosine-5)-methyltransferase 1